MKNRTRQKVGSTKIYPVTNLQDNVSDDSLCISFPYQTSGIFLGLLHQFRLCRPHSKLTSAVSFFLWILLCHHCAQKIFVLNHSSSQYKIDHLYHFAVCIRNTLLFVTGRAQKVLPGSGIRLDSHERRSPLWA